MATITLTASAPVASRVVAAYGLHLGLGRDATLQEVHDEIARQTIAFVKHIERQTAAVSDLEIT